MFMLPMSSEQISGRRSSTCCTRWRGVRRSMPGPGFIGSLGSGRKRPPGPVVRLMTTSVPLWRMRSTTSAYSAPSMLGSVVFGSRTWMCTIAAPALAASIAEAAICSGVTGTAGFLPGRIRRPGHRARDHHLALHRRPPGFPVPANSLQRRGTDRAVSSDSGAPQRDTASRRIGHARTLPPIVRCAKPRNPFLERIRTENQGRFHTVFRRLGARRRPGSGRCGAKGRR